MSDLFDLPRLVRGPRSPYTVPPLTRPQRWRMWLFRRLADVLVPKPLGQPCECDGQHPHAEWPI